jgi:hypothetical protein
MLVGILLFCVLLSNVLFLGLCSYFNETLCNPAEMKIAQINGVFSVSVSSKLEYNSDSKCDMYGVVSREIHLTLGSLFYDIDHLFIPMLG